MTTEHQPDLPEIQEPQLPAVTAPREPTPELGALATFREAFMGMAPEDMKLALAEYAAARKTFFAWLMGQLVKGIHYGYPPDCKPELDEEGCILQWKRDKQTDKWNQIAIPKEQWQAKPSLYKAGAQLIVELMGVRAEYEADVAAWQQLGSSSGMVVLACRILSPAGEVIGQGLGSFTVGEKKMGANSALKMAKKRALVDAVLDTWGLADAFTQDLDDPDTMRPKHPNPKAATDAPQSAPRAERITSEQLTNLKDVWKERQGEPVGWSQFQKWVEQTVGRYFDVRKAANWARKDLETCCKALGVPL